MASSSEAVGRKGPSRVDWPELDERLLELRDKGLTFAEIGKLFGLSVNTVRARWNALADRPAHQSLGAWRPSSDLLRLRQICADAFGITEAELLGRSRVRRICQPRMAICYIIRAARPRLSYPCIAVLIGGRDHSTIIHAVRQTEVRMRYDAALAGQVEALVAMFARRADVRQHDAHIDVWREFCRLQTERDARAALRRIDAKRREAEAEAEARLQSDDEFVAALDPERVFCGQCDRAVTPMAAARCGARICGLRERRAA